MQLRIPKFEVATPISVANSDVLERNIKLMAEKAEKANVALRPHVKTHKTKEIANMQIAAGAKGITCAKVSEAGTMVALGMEDVLIAYPVVGKEQLLRAMQLSTKCKLTMAFDSVYGVTKINEFAQAHDLVMNVYLIVNTGANRDGVLPEEALAVCDQIKDLKNISLTGVMTHEGHVYKGTTKEELPKIAKQAALTLVDIAEMLREKGFIIEHVSIGSTPTCLIGEAIDGVTEWRPGTYVFNDVQENMLVTSVRDCAFTVLSTIVSNPSTNRYILDAGSKTLSLSHNQDVGYGYIKQDPRAKILNLTEEHAVVFSECTFSIGQVVEIIPIHVCPVVNLTDVLWIEQDGYIVDRWPVMARGQVI